MRALALFLGGLLLAVVLAHLLAADANRVAFTWNEWLIQTRLAVFVCVFAAAFALCGYAVVLLSRLLGLPRRYARRREYRRQERAERHLRGGMLAMVEGDWAAAEAMFRKGAADSAQPMVNYLGAARAAQLQERWGRRDHYLRLAYRASSGRGDAASPAVALTQAELQLERKQYRQAYTTLKRFAAERPEHEQAQLLLLDAAAALKEWRQALALLRRLKGGKLLAAGEWNARRVAAYAGLLQDCGESPDPARLRRLWQAIPAPLRRQPYVVETYVRQRLRSGETEDCEPLLRKALRHEWTPELARLFGLVEGKDAAAQLRFMERFLATREDDAVLLLSLGRLSRRNNLWGKARAYLERGMAAQPHPETCQELAQLLERQGDAPAASRYYRQGLGLATGLSAPAYTPPASPVAPAPAPPVAAAPSPPEAARAATPPRDEKLPDQEAARAPS